MLWKIMKFIFNVCIVMFIVTVGCSSFTPRNGNVSSELVPYLVEFVQASDGKVEKEDLQAISLVFVKYEDPEDSTVLGTCYYLTTTVTINQGNWRWLSEIERKALIFHELGHCVLKRDHTERYFSNEWDNKLFDLGILKEKPRLKDNCPGSIMNPVIVDERCLEKHYDYYLKELFAD